jgi:hypothetical protein
MILQTYCLSVGIAVIQEIDVILSVGGDTKASSSARATGNKVGAIFNSSVNLFGLIENFSLDDSFIHSQVYIRPGAHITTPSKSAVGQ